MNAATILKSKGRGVATATANKSLLDIAKLLVQHGIGCIVIVGNDDKIAGIVSERDLMHAIGQSGSQGFEGAGLGLHDQEGGHGAGGRHRRPIDVGNDHASVPPHARSRERPADRPRLHWRLSQDFTSRMPSLSWARCGSTSTSQPSLLFDKASRLRLAGGA